MHHQASRRRLLVGGGALAVAAVAGATGLAPPGAAGSPAQAAQQPGAPRVYTRAEWGARPPNGTISYLDRQPDHVVVHHTAGENTDDFSLEAAFAHSKWIQDLHMDERGWVDSGQQLTISRGGYVMEGRDLSLRAIRERQHVSGAHVANHNDHLIGIENEGIYVSEPVPDPLFESLVLTCAWLCQAYQLDPIERITGHRDYNPTQCPGDVLYARLPELRERVADQLSG